jgi:ferredoxin/flavodoxin---NADP+ reductase
MPTATEKYQKADITWRKDFAPDLWSVRVRPEQKLPFKPGQYATLGFRQGDRVIERPYSIVSSPLEDQLEFFFERVPHGDLTPCLYNLQVGDSMLMRWQAKGLFAFDGTSGHSRHGMVATVTGIAPYVSMVRTFAREADAGASVGHHELLILQSASRSWEFGYREELEGFARRYKWLRYVPTVSRPWEDPAWEGERGRAEDVLRKHLDASGFDPSQTTSYLCGHPEMIKNARGILIRRGIPKEFIREEVYWVPRKDSGV